MKGYGIGEKKTPAPFIVACDKFVYIEVIRAAAVEQRLEDARQNEKKAAKSTARKVPSYITSLLADSVEDLADEEGYASLGELGSLLIKKQPDFDPRNFGFSKLSQLVRSIDRFELDIRQSGKPHTKHIYVRDREAAK